jgi:hypothetical protein
VGPPSIKSAMTNKKYFFPAHDSNIILVDAFYKNIWLTTTNENIAHCIRKAFYSKLNLVVYNLHSFKNYQPNLVDNEVCLDWQITPSKNIGLIQQSQHYEILNQTQQAEDDQTLINVSPTRLLSNEKIINLQQQLMMYHCMFDGIDNIDAELETQVNNIFSYNLNLEEIESSLAQLPIELLYSSELGRKLLTITNRLYA